MDGRFESTTSRYAVGGSDDKDNDHSFSQLSVHKALTCPEDQSTWAVRGPFPG